MRKAGAIFGRFIGTNKTTEVEAARGFDSFEVLLGDVMRGERATLGKSLLDVQRELRIKAAYIAAIEGADPSAFESQGFIAGYVRSYARYLGLDPEWAFQTFCAESGFAGVHGMSAKRAKTEIKPITGSADFVNSGLGGVSARGPKPARVAPKGAALDPILAGRTAFIPESTPFFAQVEAGALGSLAVLATLIAGLGYGAWSVVHEFQRVQVSPVEEAPGVFAELDPLASATRTPALSQESSQDALTTAGLSPAPSVQSFDRLYRPQALDVPILTPRDAPIATLTPGALGAIASPAPSAEQTGILTALAEANSPEVPQVLAAASDKVLIFATNPAWVRVRAADGSVLYEKIMEAGDSYEVPLTEVPATLHAGNSGAIYFQLNGQTFGPSGAGASVVRNVPLAPQNVQESYAVVDLTDASAQQVSVALAQLAPAPLPASDSPN